MVKDSVSEQCRKSRFGDMMSGKRTSDGLEKLRNCRILKARTIWLTIVRASVSKSYKYEGIRMEDVRADIGQD
jgi:hypothetical protein